MTLFLVFALILTFCTILPYFFYRRVFPSLRSYPCLVLWIILSCSFLVTRSFPVTWPLSFVRAWTMVSGYWLIFSFYSFLIIILWFLLVLFLRFFTRGDISRYRKNFILVMLMGVLIACVYGTNNAHNPRVIHETIVSNKLSSPMTILYVSDLHLGRLLGKEYCEDLVERINKEHPDVVIIGGDIIDDQWDYVAATGSYKPLGNLHSKYGTYAVLGNHDYFTPNTKLEITALEALNVNILRNQAVHIGKIKLAGLDDYSHNKSDSSLKLLSKGNANEFAIVVDHQPRRMEKAAALGYDLYLSGHTHEGQVFPNNLIVKYMYALSYGRGQFGNMVAYVTSGYGLWGVPMRLGSNPELVVLELKAK